MAGAVVSRTKRPRPSQTPLLLWARRAGDEPGTPGPGGGTVADGRKRLRSTAARPDAMSTRLREQQFIAPGARAVGEADLRRLMAITDVAWRDPTSTRRATAMMGGY